MGLLEMSGLGCALFNIQDLA